MALDLAKLLEFPDDSKLSQYIEGITRLNDQLDRLASSAKNSADRYTAALTDIQKSADSLEKSMASLDATNKRDQETISKQSKAVDQLSADNENYVKSLEDVEAEYKTLQKTIAQLEEAKRKLEEANKDEEGSLNDLKKKLTEAKKAYAEMGDASSEADKQMQLEKIRDTAAAYNQANDAVKEAAKGVKLAAGSYKELEARVNDAKKRLKEMSGGLDETNQEANALKKEISEGTETLKEFDSGIGDNKRNVGDYGQAVEVLDDRLGGLIGATKRTIDAFKALATNPYFLILAGIIAVITAVTSAVKTYYSTVGEGEDVYEKEKNVFSAFYSVLSSGWANLGKGVSDYIQELGGLSGIAIKAAKWFTILTTGSKQLGDSLEIALNAVKKTAEDTADVLDHEGDAAIRNIIAQAQSTKQINELLVKSNDTLNYSDQQRLNMKRAIAKIQDEQSKQNVAIAKEELDGLERLLAQTHAISVARLRNMTQEQKEALLTGEEREKLAQATAKVINEEAAYFAESKKNAAQIIALTQEIEKRKRDAANRAFDTEQAINEFLLQDSIKTNQAILADVDSSMEQRITAIEDMTRQTTALLELQKQNELNIVQRAAEDRIRAEGKNVTAELLALDEGLQNQRVLINEKYLNLIADTNKKSIDLVQENVFKVLERDAKHLSDEIAIEANEQLTTLNESYKDRSIKMKDFESARKQATEDAAKSQLQAQLNYLNEVLTQVGLTEGKRTDIEKQASAIREKLSEENVNKMLADEKKLQAGIIQIKNETLALGEAILAASVEKAIAASEAELSRLSDEKDKRLAIVGDDAQARAAIETAFAEKQKAIAADIAAQKRKLAIFDKARAASQIVVDTARAVMATLAEGGFFAIPLTAVVAAIGGLQLARVLATPIPAFASGVDYSPEGLALVGEAGREIAFDRKTNKAKLYDTPTYTFLNKGTKILNNEDTEKLIEQKDITRINQISSLELADLNDQRVLDFKADAIGQAVNKSADRIIEAVKSSQDIIDEEGRKRYERNEAGRVLRLDKRFRLQ